MVREVQTLEEFHDLINKSKYTIVDFTATWCPPCKMIKPFFDEQSNIYTDVQFLKVDVDDLSDVAAEANIKAMPTFIIYENGKIRDDLILQGASRERLVKLVKTVSSINPDSEKPTDSAAEFKPSYPSEDSKRKDGKCEIL